MKIILLLIFPLISYSTTTSHPPTFKEITSSSDLKDGLKIQKALHYTEADLKKIEHR